MRVTSVSEGLVDRKTVYLACMSQNPRGMVKILLAVTGMPAQRA